MVQQMWLDLKEHILTVRTFGVMFAVTIPEPHSKGIPLAHNASASASFIHGGCAALLNAAAQTS